jgi:predicted negative regulator of RcsB-dependent stress response
MNIYVSEKEQIQLMKDWLKEYGPTILTAIVVFMTVSIGWRYWQQYTTRQKSLASIAYTQMFTARAQHKSEEAQLFANNLVKNFPRSPYASFAAMILAQEAVAANNLAEAKKNLLWVMQHASRDELRELARIRQARILLAQNKPEEVLLLLAQGKSSMYAAAKEEIKGDAFSMQHNRQEGRAAYVKALQYGSFGSPLLQMKSAGV